MNKTHRTLVLSGITLALTSFTAFGNQSPGWYYDEDFDTIVFEVENSRSGVASNDNRGLSGGPKTEQSRSWYHDEKGDTIVFNVPGSRAGIPPSAAGSPSVLRMAERDVGWYYDEQLDTIIFDLMRN